MMLGYNDIVKALGKDIGVFPLKDKNIKGDAINLSASEYAWSLCKGEIWLDDTGEIYIQKPSINLNATKYIINEKDSAVIEYKQKKYVVVLPKSTTLIETQEVIAISSRIGGSFHSKGSIVSKGLCSIGDYLEPNFRGHSLVSVQNPGEKAVLLLVGEKFTAITFFYLKTAVAETLLSVPGSRFEILVQCGIHVSEDAKAYLSEPWKSNSGEINQRMLESEEYIRLMRSEKDKRRKRLLGYFNIRNALILLFIFIVLISLYIVACTLDKNLGGTVWKDRFWNVGCSGIIVSFIVFMLSIIKNEK